MHVTEKEEKLTGGLLHLHHESLESIECLQLLYFIREVLLQQLGPLVNLLHIHLVGVLTYNGSLMHTINIKYKSEQVQVWSQKWGF